MKNCFEVSFGHKKDINGAYLLARFRTLLLLRMRCGCFATEAELGGIDDSVWTLERQNTKEMFGNMYLYLYNTTVDLMIKGDTTKNAEVLD